MSKILYFSLFFAFFMMLATVADASVTTSTLGETTVTLTAGAGNMAGYRLDTEAYLSNANSPWSSLSADSWFNGGYFGGSPFTATRIFEIADVSDCNSLSMTDCSLVAVSSLDLYNCSETWSDDETCGGGGGSGTTTDLTASTTEAIIWGVYSIMTVLGLMLMVICGIASYMFVRKFL